VIFIFLFLILLRIDLVEPLDFDSSYNLLISKNLAISWKYASSNFLIPGEKFFYFDTWITTGYPLITLGALIFKVFGVNFIFPRILMNIIYLSTILMIYLIFQHIFQLKTVFGKIRVLITIVFLSFILNLHYLGIHFLGETLGFLFLLLGVFLCRKYLSNRGNLMYISLSSLFFSLSVITKNFYFFLSFPFLLLTYFQIIKKGGIKWTKKLGVIFLSLIFLSVPILILIIWINKYYSLNAYLDLYKSTLQTQGLLKDSLTMSKFIFLLQNTNERIKIPYFLNLFLIYLITTPLLLRKKYIRETISILFYYIFLISSPVTFYERYTVWVLFVLILFNIFFLVYAFKDTRQTILLANVVFILLIAFSLNRIYFSVKTNPRLISQKNISYILNKDFKSSTIYFIGWWKAPDIQLLSNRDFILFNDENIKLCKNECYLIIDPLFKKLDPSYNAQKETLVNKFGKPYFQYEDYDLYEIK